jgi:cystathionine beta-lyase/cystathionine gamma-synthase
VARSDRLTEVSSATLLAALVEGSTVAEAAKAANLSERTAYRRLAEPDFRRELAERRRQLVDAVSARLAAVGDSAIDTLLELQRGGDNIPASVRLSAARCLLEHMGKLSELAETADLGDRLGAIEETLERMIRPRGAAA